MKVRTYPIIISGNWSS